MPDRFAFFVPRENPRPYLQLPPPPPPNRRKKKEEEKKRVVIIDL